MKNKKISIKTIIIIVLIGIIITLIFINLNNKNKYIAEQNVYKEQLEQTSSDNTYVDINSHLSEVNEKEQKLLSFKSSIATAITNEGIATSSSDTAETMSSNISNILKTRTTLSSDVAATADNISEGKQAWVNGQLITGNCSDSSPNLKVEVTRTHIDGSGYADKQTVNVVVYYNNEIVINKSMTNSSAYNQSATYTYPE